MYSASEIFTMMYFMCDDDCLGHHHYLDDYLNDTDYDDDYYDDDDLYGSGDEELNLRLAMAERVGREITDEERANAEIARNSLLEETLHNSSSLDQEASKLFSNQRYSDIVLIVGKRKFHVHRMVLSAWSDVFKTMLCDPTWQPNNNIPEPKSTGSQEPILQDLFEEDQCAEVFEDFLKFLYSSSVTLITENVLPLCRLADKYLVTELRELCLEFVQGKRDNNNAALYLLQSASKLEMPRVVETCLEILQTNFSNLTGQQLQQLDTKNVIALLDSGLSVLVDEEVNVFEKIEPWLTRCRDDDAFIQVIKLIRFPYLNATQLKMSATSSVIQRAFRLIPDFELKYWQLQALYSEGNHDRLPGEFPRPRMYFFGYKKQVKPQGHNGPHSSAPYKFGCTEVKVDDHARRRGEAFRAWIGHEVEGKQFFELKDSNFPFKVTKSKENSNEVDIELFPIPYSRKRKQHIALEVEVAKQPCQYFRTVLQNNPNMSATEDGSVHCRFSSGVDKPRPDKFKLRVSAVIECEEAKDSQEVDDSNSDSEDSVDIDDDC